MTTATQELTKLKEYHIGEIASSIGRDKAYHSAKASAYEKSAKITAQLEVENARLRRKLAQYEAEESSDESMLDELAYARASR